VILVLDTNVVSEFMKARPDPQVLTWIDSQLTSSLFVTTITEAEVRTGIAYLPEGRRQRGLTAAADRAFDVLFADRILPFDSTAARAYATIASGRRAAGDPISQSDCQIAAIVRSRGMTVATRNVRDFADNGID
jgi:predicted nucleic acid-binding protein